MRFRAIFGPTATPDRGLLVKITKSVKKTEILHFFDEKFFIVIDRYRVMGLDQLLKTEEDMVRVISDAEFVEMAENIFEILKKHRASFDVAILAFSVLASHMMPRKIKTTVAAQIIMRILGVFMLAIARMKDMPLEKIEEYVYTGLKQTFDTTHPCKNINYIQ